MMVLLIDQQEEVLTLTLNRPEKRNALTIAMMEQIAQAIQECLARVIVIKGAGKVFCAGLDLEEGREEALIERSTQALGALFQALDSCSALTIASVQGAAFAGGAGVMAACDYVLTEEEAAFAFPEIFRGLIPARVMVILLQHLSIRDIKTLLLFGKRVDAKEALRMGLVSAVVQKEQLDETLEKVIKTTLKGAPQAQKKTKKLLDMLTNKYREQHILTALETHREARLSREAAEGMAAFLEKREPEWGK